MYLYIISIPFFSNYFKYLSLGVFKGPEVTAFFSDRLIPPALANNITVAFLREIMCLLIIAYLKFYLQ